jgi:hypothetical protein
MIAIDSAELPQIFGRRSTASAGFGLSLFPLHNRKPGLHQSVEPPDARCYKQQIRTARLETDGWQMDPSEETGFSRPNLLHKRGSWAARDIASDASDALTRRVAPWVNASVAVFTPIFAIAVIFGWISLRASLEVAVFAGSCILAFAIMLWAAKLRRIFRRASNPAS